MQGRAAEGIRSREERGGVRVLRGRLEPPGDALPVVVQQLAGEVEGRRLQGDGAGREERGDVHPDERAGIRNAPLLGQERARSAVRAVRLPRGARRQTGPAEELHPREQNANVLIRELPQGLRRRPPAGVHPGGVRSPAGDRETWKTDSEYHEPGSSGVLRGEPGARSDVLPDNVLEQRQGPQQFGSVREGNHAETHAARAPEEHTE